MEDTHEILFEDRRSGRRERRAARDLPDEIRAVSVDGERVPVARVATFERAGRVVVEQYDAAGRCLARTVGHAE